VIGYNGLLGSAVCRVLEQRGMVTVTPEVRWATSDAVTDLITGFDAFVANPGPWAIAWCAGAGVPSTPQHVFDEEIVTFRAFLDHVAGSERAPDGTIFFASSAGGVYAGSQAPPFTEATEPIPLAPYGHSKLALEAALSQLTQHGVRVMIGRIANLYGPGQNLGKAQGLVSMLGLSVQTGTPLGVYVSLDTLRDYIYVDDAAALIVDFLERGTHLAPGSPPVIKILASHQSVSIAELLGTYRTLIKRRPPVVLAASPHTKVQARDLRMRSIVWPELDQRTLTPFPVGVANTLADVGERWRNAA